MLIRELAKHLIVGSVIVAAPIAWSASTTAGVTTGTNTSGTSTSAGTSAGTSGNAGVSAGTSGSATQPVVPGANNQQQSANNGSDKTTDDELVQKVKAALVNDNALATKSISATARQGTIILTGTVSSQAERAKAAQLVSSIEGVAEVKNQIKVK